jgi:hypothetical protein
VFSYSGVFELDVQLASGTVYLYVGAHQVAGTLIATVESSKTVVQKTTPRSGAGSVNVVFEISWRKGPLKLEFKQAGRADEERAGEEEEDRDGGPNVTWQSAALAPPAGCPDGATICIKDPTILSKAVDLSEAGQIDWVHFGGGTGAAPAAGSSVWSPVVKASGPGLLKASLKPSASELGNLNRR